MKVTSIRKHRKKKKENRLNVEEAVRKRVKLLVIAESIPLEGEVSGNGKPRKAGYIKMFVIENLKSFTIDKHVTESIDKESIIDSDHSTSYTNFSRLVKEHRPRVIPKKEVETILPWVYIAISNAKRMLSDIFHDIKPEYLQNYLNEFCYKFNRRYFGELRFDRLMIAAVETKNQFRDNIR
jgi:hypothetical protein